MHELLWLEPGFFPQGFLFHHRYKLSLHIVCVYILAEETNKIKWYKILFSFNFNCNYTQNISLLQVAQMDLDLIIAYSVC